MAHPKVSEQGYKRKEMWTKDMRLILIGLRQNGLPAARPAPIIKLEGPIRRSWGSPITVAVLL